MADEIQTLTSDENFAKFVKKAKRRLNKAKETKEEKFEEKPKIACDYTFVKSSKADEEKEMIQKIKQLLSKEPDIPNPIGRLLQEERFSKMEDTEKQRYILRLSKLFNETKLT